MTELQGAVALAQLERVQEIVTLRNRLGSRLDALLHQIPAITPQTVPAGSRHSYFMYLFQLNLAELGCSARDFCGARGRGRAQRSAYHHWGSPRLSVRYLPKPFGISRQSLSF